MIISLDLEHQLYAIEEEWSPEVPDRERAWLAAFAAVSSVMRFAAYMPPNEQLAAIQGYAAGTEWFTDTWRRRRSLGFDDVVFTVEVLGTAHGEAASAYLETNVQRWFPVRPDSNIHDPFEICRWL